MTHKNKSDTAKQLLALSSRGGGTLQKGKWQMGSSSFKERWRNAYQKHKDQNSSEWYSASD